MDICIDTIAKANSHDRSASALHDFKTPPLLQTHQEGILNSTFFCRTGRG